MELLKRFRGLDAEFFVQLAPRVQEGGQRIRLAAGPVQGQHEQAVQPLPQRMIGHQVPQLRDQVCVVAQRQVQFGAFLDDADAGFGQPVALGVEKGAAQAVANGSAPEAERVMQCSGGFPQVTVRPRGPAPAQLPVEYLKVEGAGRHGQQ